MAGGAHLYVSYVFNATYDSYGHPFHIVWPPFIDTINRITKYMHNSKCWLAIGRHLKRCTIGAAWDRRKITMRYKYDERGEIRLVPNWKL